MKFDKYSIQARVFPTILTVVIPAIVFNQFFLLPEIKEVIGDMFATNILGTIALPTVLIFFSTQFVRTLGKEIFQRFFFKEEMGMPTTEYLLFKDSTYSEDFKKKFRGKIKNDFGVTFSSKSSEEKDENLARTKIVEGMAYVRKMLFNNQFLLQHNIEYGAIRNLLGGCIIGIILCSINLFLFHEIKPNITAFNISLVIIVIYGVLIISSKWLINSYGKSYAKILLREYMSENKKENGTEQSA